MALAWLAFLKPVVDVPTVRLDGPDPLDSAAYAADFHEVKRVGSATAPASDRSAAETTTARFMNGTPAVSVVVMYREALIRHLQDDGYWRPFQAIAGAADDGNGATEPQPGWTPLIPNPAYADYTSGHAAATSPFAEVVRQTLGDDTELELRLAGFDDRTYPTLTALEHDAFMARIWGGLHFRDAMDDGYLLGHTVARSVIREIR
jgi:hypothetical protein